MPESSNNWKVKILVAGAVSGALIGLGTSYLLTRAAEEAGGTPPKIKTTDGIRIAIGVIGLVRGIIALGDSK
jgi:hypothetical protein